MADNVAVTAGTGTDIATDDVAGVHYQKVKIAIGAADTANLLAVGAGAVDTGTPRVTLASDSPGVASLALLDDAIFTDDAAYTPGTSKLIVVGAEADEGTPDAVDEGDAGALRMTLQRGLHVNVRNASGTEVAFNGNGQATMDNSAPVVIASNQTSIPTTVGAGTAMIGHVGGADYETVAASQTDQMMGPTGAAGDYLSHLLVIPATTSPGAVSIEDGATNTTVFTGGASSVTNLVPFVIPIGAKSASGGWEITTGSNVSVIAFGDFT